MRKIIEFLLCAALVLAASVEAKAQRRATQAEVECLAMNIYHEAKNQSTEGQLAVGWVTINRTLHDRWPNDICAVVWQTRHPGKRHKCQFSWTCDGKRDEPRDWEAFGAAYDLAVAIAMDQTTDPTDGSLWYHADYSRPVWRTRLVVAVQIDDHIFYNKRWK